MAHVKLGHDNWSVDFPNVYNPSPAWPVCAFRGSQSPLSGSIFPPAMTDTTLSPALKSVQTTSFAVLAAISVSHLINDMIQAVLPAIYPTLKGEFRLSFAQI